MNYLMNRLANCTNPYQGKYKRVLCVCSAGLLRSPTAAWVLSQDPYNFNTRSAGLTQEFALVPVDAVLLEWADEIVCMDGSQLTSLKSRTSKPVLNLGIEDGYPYRDPELVRLIRESYDRLSA